MSDDEEDEEANELAIDEDMSLVERVKVYCNSSISVQRLVHVRELSSCAEQIGAQETLVQLLPLLAIISSDVETPVRIAFAEQMVAFCKVLLAAPDVSHLLEGGDESSRQSAYEIVVSQCVPVLSKLLSGGSANDLSSPGGAQLCDAAAEALVELAGLLKPHDVGHTVLTTVLCLAHDNEAEENRVVATQLLGALASTVGTELCCQFVLPEIISLADDPVFRVRKAAALKVGSPCHVVWARRCVLPSCHPYQVGSLCHRRAAACYPVIALPGGQPVPCGGRGAVGAAAASGLRGARYSYYD